MTSDIKAQLAPHGVLRAAINMSNFLLVTGRSASGDPAGVSPEHGGGDRGAAWGAGEVCALCQAGRTGG